MRSNTSGKVIRMSYPLPPLPLPHRGTSATPPQLHNCSVHHGPPGRSPSRTHYINLQLEVEGTKLFRQEGYSNLQSFTRRDSPSTRTAFVVCQLTAAEVYWQYSRGVGGVCVCGGVGVGGGGYIDIKKSQV